MDKFNFSSIVAVAVVPVVSSIITVATSVSDDVFGRILSSCVTHKSTNEVEYNLGLPVVETDINVNNSNNNNNNFNKIGRAHV